MSAKIADDKQKASTYLLTVEAFCFLFLIPVYPPSVIRGLNAHFSLVPDDRH